MRVIPPRTPPYNSAAIAAAPSRKRRTPPRVTAITIGLLAMLATGVGAQAVPSTTDSLARQQDSLALRLRRAEDAIAALQQQVADQATSGVQSRSRARLELHGRVIVNAFSNERRVNNVDDPQFVRPDSASALPVGGAGMAIRQTSLGLAVFVSDVLGGRFTGDLDADFFGGQQPSSGGRTFPLLRLRTARAMVQWTHADMLVGQEQPLIAGLNPRSVAALGTPDFVAAGNLWLWLPQLRAGVHSTGSVRFGLQGAVLAPTSGDAANAFDTDVDVAERSRRPFLEARGSVAWGEDELAGEIGCGAHAGWLALSNTTTVRGEAFACDARVPLGARFELRGEGYAGRGVRGLGGGAIGQNSGIGLRPPRTRAGWAQASIRVTQPLLLGVGCGVDDPQDAELAPGARLLNRACAAHMLLRGAGPLFLGAEVRRLETTYAAGRFINHHLNLGVGFEF